MAKILSFIDRRQKIKKEEGQRLHPDDFIKINFDVIIFRPALSHLKNRRLTRYQAKSLYALLRQAFEVKPWETETNPSILLEYEWSQTKSSFLPRCFEKGELLIHEIVSSIQQKTFSRSGAIHIMQVARLWYKEVLQ
jgi:hypothetical protein